MANPTLYKREHSFTAFQANSPQKPLPGQKVDQELDAIERTTTELISGLGDIRRSDGKLKNGIVTATTLSPEISTGVQPAVEWVTATTFQARATVFYGTAFYRALVDHVSGAFANDLAAGRWERYADFQPVIDAAEDAAAAAIGAAAGASGSAGAAASSAGTASGSAGAAASSANNAAASAGAASDSADAAAASAVQAANTVGNATAAVRWDVAQSLSSGQKLQARQNIGVSSVGSDIVTAANTGAAQTAIGMSTFIQALMDDADAATAQATLGGTTVGRALFTAPDAVAGRSTLAAQPASQTGSGIGQISRAISGGGNGLVLPAGGTWSWSYLAFNSSTGGFASAANNGVSAGGSTIVSGSAGVNYVGFYKRIA